MYPRLHCPRDIVVHLLLAGLLSLPFLGDILHLQRSHSFGHVLGNQFISHVLTELVVISPFFTGAAVSICPVALY